MKAEPTERDRLAMERGHPPEAHRVVCVDFDGVLYPFGMLMEAPPPIEGAVKAMQRLKASGFRIVVLTSRLSPTWLRASGHTALDQREYVSRVLTRDGTLFMFPVLFAVVWFQLRFLKRTEGA